MWSRKMRHQKALPHVSFIIPTLNAAWILPKCLLAIASQDYPIEKIEIVISDGGSTDETISIAKKYKAKIISNPEILHEPGKSRASEVATGEILFFTDADNILAHKNWLLLMTKPYLDNPSVKGFLPQTEPPNDSNSFNRYLGYLFTDPFTWFIYENAANPKDYEKIFIPLAKKDGYVLYKFNKKNYPLFGLSQGVGTVKSFKREKTGWNDDLLAGIKLMQEESIIAYVPQAAVYHYHVEGFFNFLKKYRWRIRNNLQQQIKGMGYTNREKYLSTKQKKRKMFFIPYGLSIILPLIDTVMLSIKYKDLVMLWHLPACVGLSYEILYEVLIHNVGIKPTLNKVYGK